MEDQNLLLVLDNCEHLIEACAETAQALVAACPNLHVMITSRRPLRIPGEVVFQVPSLSVPDPATLTTLEPGQLVDFEAVRLFVERAQLVSPAFALTARSAQPVAELCYHLDGLPLALELAASRTAALPVDAIAERLGDRFRLLVAGSRTALKRHQTLKATLDWSYGLLDDREQSLLRALACFTGGVALDAAEGVSAIGVERTEVADLLGGLVEQSILSVDDDAQDARYRLLETVREYGQALLDQTGERAALELRHADWFLDLAERTAEAIPTAGREPWLARLEMEHDNARAAFDRMVLAEPARALRLAAAMWPFWLWRGYLVEGRRRLDQVIALVRDPTPLRGEALLGATAITIRSGRLAEGILLAEQALSMLRAIGQPRAVCRVLNLLGMATWSQDDLSRSADLFGESRAVAAEAGFGPGRAAALHALGIVRWYANEAGEADALLEESLALFRGLGGSPELAPPMLDVAEFLVAQPGTGGFRIVWEESFSPIVDVPCPTATGYVLANRGMIARTDGDLVRARAYLDAALAQFEEVGDARAIAQAMARLGNLARVEGDFATARDLLQESLTIRTRLGETRSATLTMASLGNLAAGEGDFVSARELLGETADTFRRRGDRWGHASALSDLASLALLEGDPPEAIRLLEEALEVIDETGRRRWKAWALVQLAAASRQAGDESVAKDRMDDALALFRQIGDRRGEETCIDLRARGAEPAHP
jgi:predicted ATPase